MSWRYWFLFLTHQFPQELVTYGGNGQVFSNWAQVSPDLAHVHDIYRVWQVNINRVAVSPVSPGDALPQWDDRRANFGHVQRSSHGSVPQPAFLPSCYHHQWHGNCTTWNKSYSQPTCIPVCWNTLVCYTQVIPNYSSRDQYEKMFALGVSM